MPLRKHYKVDLKRRMFIKPATVPVASPVASHYVLGFRTYCSRYSEPQMDKHIKFLFLYKFLIKTHLKGFK